MTSHLDEEEPMDIDSEEEERRDIAPTDKEESISSKDGTTPLENEVNENVTEKDKPGTPRLEVEEITLNEGGVGEEGEEAEELQLQLNAPDFGDDGEEEQQLFGNGENSIDHMDDPLFNNQQDEEESNPGVDESATSLLDPNDDGSLIINETEDENRSETVKPGERSENNKDRSNDSDDEIQEVQDGENNTNLICNETVSEKEDAEGSEGGIQLQMDGLFEQQEDDEFEDDEDKKLMDVQSMLQMSFQEDEQTTQKPTPNNSKDSDAEAIDEENTPTRRTLPRRAAAAAAANTIRKISSVELDVDDSSYRRGRKEVDKTFSISEHHHHGSSDPKKSIHKCAVCKKHSSCPIKIQQFGTDVHLCSNSCFNTMRHPASKGIKRRLACVKCGISNQAGNHNYYWETMNFCSDLCVGNYQVEVGGKCATCFKRVPWKSLGKYCVRFGSDIRQFCTAPCLENYKKNARVCFHCQLDIKRLGNVILANIPSKNAPKEFCSQDCVESYVEVNLNQTVKSRSGQLFTCVICGELKIVFRELVLPSSMGLKVCSQMCWTKMLTTKALTKPVKCEKCIKYINLDDEFEPPAHYVATQDKMFCFCSATCKNVFVLNNREIKACTTCKVKKYNYDLVQFFSNQAFVYAVCSLDCLPKGEDYIKRLKGTLLPPSTASELISRNGNAFPDNSDNGSFPIINSVTSVPSDPSPENGGLTGLIHAHLQSIAGSIVVSNSNDTATYTMPQGFDTYVCGSEGQGQLSTSDDDNNWDGMIRESDLAIVLDLLQTPVDMKTKSTMAKPKQKIAETQTDVSELDDMQRVPLKTIEKIRYVPFPIPYPVYLPTPAYICEAPVPYPVAVPIPVPMPIPFIFNETLCKLHTGVSPTTLLNSLMEANKASTDKESKKPSHIDPPINGVCPTGNSSDAEITNFDDPISKNADNSLQNPDNSTLTNSETASADGLSQTKKVASSVPTFASSSSSSNLFSGTEVASSPGGGRSKLSRVEYGLRAWKSYFGLTSDPINYNSEELASKLAEWVNKATKPNGERYRAYIILYFCLGVQQYLKENKRTDSIFYDLTYHPFVKSFTDYAEIDCAQGVITPIECSHFWESKELGRSSPGVLLFSLIYLIFKHFHLRTWEQHAALHFGQIRIEEKYNCGKMYKLMSIVDVPECNGLYVQEKTEDLEMCPVRLLQLYITRCEQADGLFYKSTTSMDDRSSPIWYSSQALGQMEIYQMLTRAMMIKTDSDLSDSGSR